LSGPTRMKTRMLFGSTVVPRNSFKKIVSLAGLAVIAVICVGSLNAQQRVSKRYAVSKNVRIELNNLFGTITVESWDRDEIKLTAELESSKANVSPRQSRDELVVDVVSDNKGRADVGDINFRLQVPVGSEIDLTTKRGNIIVNNIRGRLVSAHVTLEGDITLTGITAPRVFAQNTIGDIFFDGEFPTGGTYRFQSGKGAINIRIPADSAFNLDATASNKQIQIGPFWNNNFQRMGDGRKYVGDVGDGRSKVVVTSFQGSITFVRR
jgi:hypothetical protein